MKVSAAPETLPFGDFLAVLRARGFTIGVEHHLRLARLLERVGGSIAPADLKRLLCPIFATDATEQQAFYAAFDSCFPALLAESASASGDVAALDAPDFPPGSTWRRRALWLALALLAGSIGAFLLPAPRVPTSTAEKAPAAVEKAADVPPKNPPPAETPPTPAQTSAVENAPIIPQEKKRDEPAPAAPPPSPSSPLAALREHSLALHSLALALPLLGFAFGEWRRWRRRELLIERARGRKPPFTWPVRVAAPKIREFHSQPLYTAARALRRRQAADTERLDLGATLQATIRAGGLPRLIYRRGSRVPEYLVLIDCASPRDHLAAFFDQLAAALDCEGVFVVRYFYRGDPRVCWDERVTHSLTDLRRLHPEHRLLLFGDGAGLLEPVSGAPSAWLPLLGEWRERVLLTPAPSSRWGWREEALETQLPVVPATVEALASVPDLLERGAAGAGLATWRDDTPPVPAGRAMPLETLRAYLGGEAFEWLCACAIYPELQWNLTLHLGAQLPQASALLSEAAALRLARLPWLREGSLPENLRTQLLAALPIERQRALRKSVIELLEASPPPAASHAADARQLDIAIQRHWLNRHERTALEKAPPVAALPFGEQTRDYAELRLHETGAGSGLALRLPSRLRALLYEQATPSLGFQPMLRAAVAMLIAWSGWTLCERATTPTTSQTAISKATAPAPLPIDTTPDQKKLSALEPATREIALSQQPPPISKRPEPLPPSVNVALKASASAAQTLEDQEDWPRALEAWVEVAKNFPSSSIGKTHIGFILDSLGRADFVKDLQGSSALRKALEKAAQLRILPALMFLAENLRETEPEAAFAHYSAAAELGSIPAITFTGLMLANGYGCKQNMAEAVKYLEKAAAAPDGYRAKAALADLYLQGNYLAKDEIKAVQLLSEAAKGDDARAMDQLATCYDKGIGTAADPKRAFMLYERAATLGYHHSLGNLAVLYLNGKVDNRPEPSKAVALLRQGIAAGDRFCIYLYARCLESGIGVRRDEAIARETYKQAAEAGNEEAQKWCQDRGMEFRPPSTLRLMPAFLAEPKAIVVITKPFDLRTQFGFVKVRVGTELTMLSQEGAVVRARYGNEIVTIPIDATNLAPVLQSSKIELDVNRAETKLVRAELLARIDLMPNISQPTKDKLYRNVERSRRMGKIVTIPFESGASGVSPSDAEILKTTLEFPAVMKLRDDPTTVFVILGYADTKGDDARNIKISQARADSVYATMKNECNVVNVMHAIAMGSSKLFVEVWVVQP